MNVSPSDIFWIPENSNWITLKITSTLSYTGCIYLLTTITVVLVMIDSAGYDCISTLQCVSGMVAELQIDNRTS